MEQPPVVLVELVGGPHCGERVRQPREVVYTGVARYEGCLYLLETDDLDREHTASYQGRE